MKILRKGDEFMKVPDSSMQDLIKINSLLENGWNYSPKKDYKEIYKHIMTATEMKAEDKKEKKIKDKKEKKVNKEVKDNKNVKKEKKSKK